MGDGAFGMSGTDLETAARSGFAITTVLVNNSSMATYAGAAGGAISPEARQFPTTGELLPSLWFTVTHGRNSGPARVHNCCYSLTLRIGCVRRDRSVSILNHAGPSSVKDGQQPTSRPGAQVPATAYGVSMMGGDYAMIAEGMGAVGITCTKVSELGPAFAKARELNSAGRTCLIQVQANVEERRSNNFKFADGVDSGELSNHDPQFNWNRLKSLAHTLNTVMVALQWVQLSSDMDKRRPSSRLQRRGLANQTLA